MWKRDLKGSLLELYREAQTVCVTQETACWSHTGDGLLESHRRRWCHTGNDLLESHRRRWCHTGDGLLEVYGEARTQGLPDKALNLFEYEA